MSKFTIYLKSILTPVFLGGIVGLLVSPFMDYEVLNIPPFSPPGFIFPIVWTILYILMGISYGILKSNSLTDDSTKRLYYSQLFVNVFWPIIFFVLKLRLFAFDWILLLIFLIVKMIYNFYSKNKISGLLQIPYLLWCCFAAYLNLFTYLIN